MTSKPIYDFSSKHCTIFTIISVLVFMFLFFVLLGMSSYVYAEATGNTSISIPGFGSIPISREGLYALFTGASLGFSFSQRVINKPLKDTIVKLEAKIEKYEDRLYKGSND